MDILDRDRQIIREYFDPGKAAVECLFAGSLSRSKQPTYVRLDKFLLSDTTTSINGFQWVRALFARLTYVAPPRGFSHPCNANFRLLQERR